MIDEFTVAYGVPPGVCVLEIEAGTSFQTYAAHRNDQARSVYAEALIDNLREEMSVAKRP